MMETYAERLKKEKEKTMTNYDMDELRRQGKVPDLEKRKEFAKDLIESEKQSVKLGVVPPTIRKDEEPWTAVDIELRDEDFMRIAQEAHARDITINKMVNIILKDGIKNAEYRFEHQSKPELLKEY